jgi:catalase (peroxidase I)
MVPVSNGYLGTWTANPTLWTNDYFTGLLNRPWDPVTLANGNMQFQR